MIDEPRTAICEIIMQLLSEGGHTIRLNPAMGYDSLYIDETDDGKSWDPDEVLREIHIADPTCEYKNSIECLFRPGHGPWVRERFKFPDIENPDFDMDDFFDKVLKALNL